MFQHAIFKIDEHHVGLEVNTVYKEYRYPVEMLACGQKYDGIETTLNKPHGKKIIMEFVINLLLKGPKQYKPFVNQILQRYTWLELNDVLEILLLDGVIQIIFKNQNPRKMVNWLPKTIQLDPRAMGNLLGNSPDYKLELSKLKDTVVRLVTGSQSSIRKNLLRWVEEEEIKNQSGTVVVDCKSFKKYKSILLTVAYYIHLKETGRKLPLRYISNQVWNKPKLLSLYKNDSALLAGIPLNELESVLLPDINSSLYAPLILISPVEKLQKLITELSDILESDIKKPELLICLNKTDYCTQNILEIIADDNSVTDNYLKLYDVLKNDLVEGNYRKARLTIINDLEPSIKVLKKQLLKIERMRQQFELIALEEIGSGSFARVYKVFDPEYKKIVACKVLFPRSHFKQVYGNDGDEYIIRFKREVKLLNEKLQHNNIVEVEKLQLEGAPFWFTMPLASYSLEKWVKENGGASEEQRIQIFKQIISGVKYLHEENRYHRDLAPNNILLYDMDNGPVVKIADFGLAKDPESMSFFTGLSKRGYGQENFTDPEQLNNLAKSTNLSDIYSLGALLYYLLSGKLPKKRKYVPVTYQNVVMRAMDTRKNRYQTICEFENDFNKYLKQTGELRHIT
ncbi:serine/threonine protein kinase [Paenibacillus profundus]|uniref:non-specific serine/threonine protein kinase n=1 Tax=Paenibacillus profundus TaxID=1173085 RepID=A0ABS8YNC9_9BACL|nr:serine/threonine-protein kinase [Paenibacillus profundus]MCE5171825.1 serine/threonine protein kinase [Paenibacillus profundus]